MTRTLAALVVAGAATACSTPWSHLHQHFPTKEEPPAAAHDAASVVLKSTHTRGAFSYSGATYSLDDQGLFLSVPGGWRNRGDAVRVPIAAIEACSRSVWESHSDSNLWVAAAAVEISLPDDEKHVVEWCTDNGIDVVDRATALKLLHGE